MILLQIHSEGLLSLKDIRDQVLQDTLYGMNKCKSPNDHDFIIDEYNDLVCTKCKREWMELTLPKSKVKYVKLR